MTDIQRQSIGLALQGNDILGAAKTGSGKTLAFLIPVWTIQIFPYSTEHTRTIPNILRQSPGSYVQDDSRTSCAIWVISLVNHQYVIEKSLFQVLEILYCKQWTRLDGLGALIITPTRELAYQIYETLRKVGQYHDISAGLIIGGKDLKFEKKRMDQCNIVICTPGRLLQHMDENPLFNCVNMQVIVE